MPKTKQLIDLFSAIGKHDLAQATSVARKLAAQHGSRGQFRAERDLLGALNGATRPVGSEQAPTFSAWSVTSSLMPLPIRHNLANLELSRDIRATFKEIVNEWLGRARLAEHHLPRRWRLLFHGPSGCGKSATAAALAVETKLPGYLVRFDSLIGAYLGQTALRLRELFHFAAQTPCVLLFDEVDALAKRRGSPMEVGELDRIVIAFMQELEHAQGDGFVIATSNLPNVLDDALWRRFDLRVTFPRPKIAALKHFANRQAKEFGLRVTQKILASVGRAKSFSDAEQIIAAEARRRVLSLSK